MTSGQGRICAPVLGSQGESMEKKGYWFLVLLVWIMVMMCASAAAQQARPGADDSETVRAALERWLKEEKVREISSRDLFDLLADDKPANDPFMVDLRMLDSALPSVYAKAHISGAVSIPWRSIVDEEVLRSLPRNRTIVVYCYNGHIGRRVSTVLSLLGYDCVNLRWGFTSWVCDPSRALGRYAEQEDCGAFPVETTERKAEPLYPVPEMKQSQSDTREAIRISAAAWLKGSRPGEISNQEVYEQIMDPDVKSEPFILDVRSPAEYARGHIKGAVNIHWRNVATAGNLRRLPPDRRIVVYGGTGGDEAAAVTVVLTILGYEAVNLRWGMTSWSYNREIAPGRFEGARDCAGFPFSIGFGAGTPMDVY